MRLKAHLICPRGRYLVSTLNDLARKEVFFMGWGIDSSSPLTNEVSCIKDSTINGNPILWVVRYYNVNDPSKNLTKSEAQALSNAGLGIIANWENGYPTSTSYFTNAQGQADGLEAFSYAADTIGQPGYTPVYFSVDYNAYTSADKTAILDYFTGVAQGYEQYKTNQASQGLPVTEYYIGVYGEYEVLSGCNDVGAATYFWQAYSPGYENSTTQFASDNLWQKSSEYLLCTVYVDNDEGFGNPGSWTI